MGRVVIVGAGVAALEALIALRASEVPAAVVLVAPDDRFRFGALDSGERLERSDGESWPLRSLATRAGASLVRDHVEKVDLDGRELVLGGGRRMPYDALLLAPGARRVPAFDHGTSVEDDHGRRDLAADLEEGTAGRVCVVVPDDAPWPLPAYELALMSAAYGRTEEVELLTPEVRPLECFGAAASGRVREVLEQASVRWQHARRVVVASSTAVLAPGGWRDVDRLLHLPFLAGPGIAGTPQDADGFVVVDDAGQVAGAEGRAWGAGDGTTNGRGHGGIAAHQAVVCAQGIAAEFGRAIDAPAVRPLLRGVLRTADGPLFLEADPVQRDVTSRWSTEPLWSPAAKVDAPHLAALLADEDGGRSAPVRLPAA